jgi:hypothetical protein
MEVFTTYFMTWSMRIMRGIMIAGMRARIGMSEAELKAKSLEP